MTELHTKREAAIRARISERTLERLFKTGTGPRITKICGRVLVRSDHLDAWIRSLSERHQDNAQQEDKA